MQPEDGGILGNREPGKRVSLYSLHKANKGGLIKMPFEDDPNIIETKVAFNQNVMSRAMRSFSR